MNNPESTNKISAQNLSLPKGGGALQGIGSKIQIQEFSGSAGFVIPIFASSCRDITPNIELSYSSGSGNGNFGIGWNLALPKISRKTEHAIPQYNTSDLFVLDDSSDLVAMTGDDRTASINNINYNITRYLERAEGNFSLIEFYQNPSQAADCFWQVTNRNNEVRIYGKNNSAKIYDTSSTTPHIFTWLLEEIYNDKGDHQILKYKKENADNVITTNALGQNRDTNNNRYIERILYGYDNSVAESLILNQKPVTTNVANWHFEIVFDYGEYDLTSNNPYQPSTKWSCRPDVFSTYNAGFEIRTYRRCANILMFHRFSELGANPLLVNTLNFTYQDLNSAAKTAISQLISSARTGYYYSGDAYSQEALPAINFDYSNFDPLNNNQFQAIATTSQQSLTAISESSSYNFVDLFSEGVAGILYSNNNGNYYRRPVLANCDGYFAATAVQALYSPSKISTTALQYQQNWQLLSSFPAVDYVLTLSDISGNGKMDLLANDNNLRGFWQADFDQTWKNFQPFQSFPSDYFSPQQHGVDTTGSGLSDLLQINNNQLKIYPSLGAAGFGAPTLTPTIDGFPNNLESSPTKLVCFANIDGSGRSHLVVITATSVTYWPNLGYGNFGKAVVMDNSPQFGADFDIKNLFIADLDGSGTCDLIYFSSGTATVYFNYNGNSFSNASTPLTLPINYDDFTKISFADINGRGNQCLIISDLKCSDSTRHWYYDFCRGNKPYLLNHIDNNLGATTTIAYGSSVDFYSIDKAAGLNWVTNLPFLVHVVTQITQQDKISGAQHVSQYAYHHGYYDGVEKEFRGFGRVDRQDAEFFPDIAQNDPQYSAPSLHRTWYNTGFADQQKMLTQYSNEYFSQDSQAFASATNIINWNDFTNLSDEDKHLAYVAMAGQVIRNEVYGLDGNTNPYLVSENSYVVKLLQPQQTNRYSVFVSHLQQSLNYDYERNPADPQITQEFILAIDDYANVTSSCNVHYGRRTVAETLTQQQNLRVTCSTFSYFNQSEITAYQLGVLTQNQLYEITEITAPVGAAFTFAQITAAIGNLSTNSNASLLNWQQIFYCDTTNTKLPLGQASLPLLVAQHAIAEFSQTQIGNIFSSVLSAADLTSTLNLGQYQFDNSTNYWWNCGLTQKYNSSTNFYAPSQVVDSANNATSYDYDNYNLVLTQVTDPLGNQMQATNIDYQTLNPTQITDINGNISQAKFDPLGRVIYTSFYGNENGQTVGFSNISTAPTTTPQNLEDAINNATNYLGNMQSFFYYDSFAWINKKEPAHFLVISAENYPANQSTPPALQYAINYSDGFGRSTQNKILVEAGTAFSFDAATKQITQVQSNNRWLTSGYVVYDNKGNAVKQYEPYYFDSALYVNNTLLNSFGFTEILYYDALGRNFQIITTKGFLLQTQQTAWQTQNFDANDSIKDSPYYQVNVVNIDSNSPYYDAAFQSNQSAKDNLTYVATYFYQTPETAIFDNLGHVIIGQKINNSKDIAASNPNGITISTYNSYDILGRLLTSSDDRLYQSNINNFSITYSMTGKQLQMVNVDAGTIWTLHNIFNNQIFGYDSRSVIQNTSYDALQRVTYVSITKTANGGDSLQLNQIVERFIYGDTAGAISNPQDYNLRGQIYQHFDQAGLVTIPSYNILGKPLSNQRQLLQDYQNEVNWNCADNLTPTQLLQALLPLLQNNVTYSQSFFYDALGRITQETDVDANITKPQYLQSGQLAQVSTTTKDDEQTSNYISAITYNAKGQRESITYGNNSTTTYTYDLKSREVLNITTSNSQNVQIQNLQYLYDPTGNVIQKTDNTQISTFYNCQQVAPNANYTFDAIYQLIKGHGRQQATNNGLGARLKSFITQTIHANDLQALYNYSEKYTYDNGGNLTQIQHSVPKNSSNSWTKNFVISNGSNQGVDATISGADNQITPAQVASFFDACGNQIQTSSINPLSWNYRNNISCATSVKRASGNDDAEYYVYDSSGQRIRKIALQYGDNEQNVTITEVIYLGNIEIRRSARGATLALAVNTEEYHVLQVNDGDNKIVSRNYWTIGTPPNSLNNPFIFYTLSDHLNSATTQVDGLGNIISIEEFSPFGNSTFFNNSGSANNLKHYRYSNKERDKTGFYYYGMRYYNPNSARWLTADPAGAIDGLNLYAFASNNPVTFVDVGGMCKKAAKKEVSSTAKKPAPVTAAATKVKYVPPASTDGVVTIAGKKINILAVARQKHLEGDSESDGRKTFYPTGPSPMSKTDKERYVALNTGVYAMLKVNGVAVQMGTNGKAGDGLIFRGIGTSNHAGTKLNFHAEDWTLSSFMEHVGSDDDESAGLMSRIEKLVPGSSNTSGTQDPNKNFFSLRINYSPCLGCVQTILRFNEYLKSNLGSNYVLRVKFLRPYNLGSGLKKPTSEKAQFFLSAINKLIEAGIFVRLQPNTSAKKMDSSVADGETFGQGVISTLFPSLYTNLRKTWRDLTAGRKAIAPAAAAAA